MSTGFQGKFHRENMISRFVKDLVRRSRSCCELCEKNGVKLEVYEVPPIEENPYADGCVFICGECRKQIIVPKKMMPDQWRCLSKTLYSEVPAVQAVAYRLLKRLSAKGVHWAEELIEHAYLDPDVEEWANTAE